VEGTAQHSTLCATKCISATGATERASDILIDLILALHENTGAQVRNRNNLSNRFQTTSGAGPPGIPVLEVKNSPTFYVLLTPPLFNPNFGGVTVAPDRPCWASARAEALSYSAVKLFSKNSNLCVADT